MHVSAATVEQVERAEPYVLFFQRLASKGTRMDRKTFKEDQVRVQGQIQAHLAAAHGGEVNNGPALRALFHSPPPELDVVFVSKHWYVRLTTMSQPGPLDNHLYLCPHGRLGLYSAEMATEPFIAISRGLWVSLAQKYGGGPEIRRLELCAGCQSHLRAYNDRKQGEYDLVAKYDTKDTGDGRFWYLVDASWVNSWKRYVRAEHVTDIADMAAPGPITNERLLNKEGDPRTPKANLRLRTDYIGVNARVWWLFAHIHGGGPVLCREDLDMYSEECSSEVELIVEELTGGGACDPGGAGTTTDLARRLSWQFVDDCQGDLRVYEERHGANRPSAEAIAADQEGRPPLSPSSDAMRVDG